jgi:glutamate---cysteine ligase / carboxylate-amine ligase
VAGFRAHFAVMTQTTQQFTFGIEEEYHLVDLSSRDLKPGPPAFMRACQTALGSSVSPELLRSQIEIATPVQSSFQDARAELVRLRHAIGGHAREHGLAPIAAATHPFGRWTEQETTPKARYLELERDLKVVGRRLSICGMHVHVGIDDPDARIDIMNQMRYFLPHLLVLSSSSPFWHGDDTGLKCYRLAVADEGPRTGLPDHFANWDDYARTLDVLMNAGVMDNATKIWWDIRPSGRFPTLEMRITDVCPRVDDAIAISALYVCLARMLWRRRRQNLEWRRYPLLLLEENRWRAQRYGLQGSLIDLGRGELVAIPQLVDELSRLIAEDAAALGCEAEIAHLRDIASLKFGGTSADRQVATRDRLLQGGATAEAALQGVVDELISETLA